MSAPLALSLLTAMLGSAAPSRPMSVEEVPAPLRPWIGWVLRDRADAMCTSVDDSTTSSLTQRCAWAARLELFLDDKGGRFVQSWHMEARAWVPLPGSTRFWPQRVSVDGVPAPATPLPSSSSPGLSLEKGEHAIAGDFWWDSLPESLPVPAETGLLALKVRGVAVEVPQREVDGTLWLQRHAADATEPVTEGDRIAIAVHRMVTDEVPLLLVTRIELGVSGKSREEVLGQVLPAGFVPLSLDTPLPARLEADSTLRVQVRPGTYVITLKARGERRIDELTRPPTTATWAEGPELWVVDPRPGLRQVTVEGVESVDPQLTSLPDDWKRLSTFPMPVGATLKLVEHRRGDSAPPPDQLTLKRELWMDFDGGGHTVRDTITGEVGRGSRMDMTAPSMPGRVSVDGADVLITRDGSGLAGVELRRSQLALSADSRIEGSVDDLPATGWATEFHQVSAIIHLPPGWRLLHATGMDEISPSWGGSFTLLDLLLILGTALAAWRLLGLRWGIVALFALALSVTEPGAPCWTLLFVLGAEGLTRVFRSGWPQRLAQAARAVLAAVLCLVAALFIAGNLQAGLYPTVVKDASNSIAVAFPTSLILIPLGVGGAVALVVFLLRSKKEAWPLLIAAALVAIGAIGVITFFGQNLRALFAASANALGGEEAGANVSSSGGGRTGVQVQRKAIRSFADQADPSAAVQTGPGIPTWDHYNTTEYLSFSGPVAAGRRVHLYLIGPLANLALAFLRSGLLALLVLALLRFPGRFWPARLRASVPGCAIALIVGAALVVLPLPAAAQVPSPEVLKELGDRLTAQPDCAHHCAASPRLFLEVGQAAFSAQMEISAAAATAVPLPGTAPDLVPGEVLLDGHSALGLARDGQGRLWLAVPSGLHRVVLSGRLPARDSLPIALPLLPHRVEARLAGWRLDGLHEDGVADDTLLLTRLGGTQAVPMALQATALPSFVTVERTLVLGLHWQVNTRVSRVSPPGMPVVLEVPLLPDESVTTAGIRVLAGKAQVSLGPTETEVSWQSELEVRPVLRLLAPSAAMLTEVWRLEAGPIWHVALGGVPPARRFADDGSRRPEWRPWPGEEAILTITRPEAVPGQILTVDHSSIELWPGRHSTEARLEVSLRSSRSGEHAFTLPEGALVEEVSVNGVAATVLPGDNRVVVPIGRGAQSLRIGWRAPEPAGTFTRVPVVDLGIPGVNADAAFHVPEDRWVLAMGGAGLGPSAQLWAVLAAVLLVSLALGRIRSTPLKWWHWLLLGTGSLQLGWAMGAFLAGALLLVGWRSSRPDLRPAAFDMRQVAIVGLGAVALILVAAAAVSGLSGRPDLAIAGNGSSSTFLRWTEDRTGSLMPRPWMVSLPLWAWRGVTLAWLGWLAIALIGWGRWGARAFAAGGAWRRSAEAKEEPPPASGG